MISWVLLRHVSTIDLTTSVIFSQHRLADRAFLKLSVLRSHDFNPFPGYGLQGKGTSAAQSRRHKAPSGFFASDAMSSISIFFGQRSFRTDCVQILLFAM
jgi:hypothetical protein